MLETPAAANRPDSPLLFFCTCPACSTGHALCRPLWSPGPVAYPCHATSTSAPACAVSIHEQRAHAAAAAAAARFAWRHSCSRLRRQDVPAHRLASIGTRAAFGLCRSADDVDVGIVATPAPRPSCTSAVAASRSQGRPQQPPVRPAVPRIGAWPAAPRSSTARGADATRPPRSTLDYSTGQTQHASTLTNDAIVLYKCVCGVCRHDDRLIDWSSGSALRLYFGVVRSGDRMTVAVGRRDTVPRHVPVCLKYSPTRGQETKRANETKRQARRSPARRRRKEKRHKGEAWEGRSRGTRRKQHITLIEKDKGTASAEACAGAMAIVQKSEMEHS